MPRRKRQKASAAISTSSSQPRRIMQTGSSEPNDGDLPPRRRGYPHSDSEQRSATVCNNRR
ncbi:hypothetical protein PSHT_07734 [Puccinia striiformis]|uniref:Uncharacterized protein n=1 Tax=Puccinia striiformis TaxID=27350 RepID=A0A2S4VVU6_9BASI|nr:hypothetical protein PSHT_07734 [Puccinia striiformis]